MWCLVSAYINNEKGNAGQFLSNHRSCEGRANLRSSENLVYEELVSIHLSGTCLHRSQRLPVRPSAHMHAPDIASHLIPAAQSQTWSQLKPYRPSGHAGQKRNCR